VHWSASELALAGLEIDQTGPAQEFAHPVGVDYVEPIGRRRGPRRTVRGRDGWDR
jgi:hypothetical protein